MEPHVKTFLYTWGSGRVTAEGEKIPGGGRDVRSRGKGSFAEIGVFRVAASRFCMGPGALSRCCPWSALERAHGCCLGRRAHLNLDGSPSHTIHTQTYPCLHAVRCEALDIGYIDGMLLLPLIIEHTIDERSPLCGHTHDSLTSLNAEIVVTFEGTTEVSWRVEWSGRLERGREWHSV